MLINIIKFLRVNQDQDQSKMKIKKMLDKGKTDIKEGEETVIQKIATTLKANITDIKEHLEILIDQEEIMEEEEILTLKIEIRLLSQVSMVLSSLLKTLWKCSIQVLMPTWFKSSMMNIKVIINRKSERFY